MAQDDVDVQVRGYRELAAGTRILVGRIEQAAPHGLQQAAGTAAGSARGRVPHRTGRLAASIHTGVGEDRAFMGYGSVPYAGWIEFGGTRGRPYIARGRYLYPAAQASEQQTILIAERVAKDEIGGMHWPTPSP